jgi:hypothetical protein
MMKRPTEQDVITAYQVMLGRPPESQQSIAAHLRMASTQVELVKNIAKSEEFSGRAGIKLAGSAKHSPFEHFNASIDVAEIIKRHANPDARAIPEYVVNFLGVVIPTKIMQFLADKAGWLDAIPIPANFHADMAEWGGALRAVDLARGSFTMIELGCGWGCWMNNTGVAARAAGLKVRLTGIEADETHLEYARETLKLNRFSVFNLLKGVAAAEAGSALFPLRSEGEDAWGFRPKFGATEAEIEQATASGKYECIAMVPLAQAIGKAPVDLLHMDIQGGELALVESTLPLLTEWVSYMVIGTHSRQIEGRLFELLTGPDWALEVERPAICSLPNGTPTVTVDGVQAWRNRRLRPDPH